MNKEAIEKLYLRSLDEKLSETENQSLADALQKDILLKQELEKFLAVRRSMLRDGTATFGPYFAQQVIARLENAGDSLDELITFFFRKYRLVALGAFATLLTINIIFSDNFSLSSLLGVQEETTDAMAEEEIVAFDFSQMFNP